jgi:quercetin dioxygenase-like cupin family protein
MCSVNAHGHLDTRTAVIYRLVMSALQPTPNTNELRSAASEPDLAMANGVDVSYLMTGKQSSGEYGLYRWDMSQTQARVPPHFHRQITESFFVLSGIVTFSDGHSALEAGPGDFHFVPRDGEHGFSNDHGSASMLILFTPGAAREEYFELLQQKISGKLSMSTDEWIATCALHDQFYR